MKMLNAISVCISWILVFPVHFVQEYYITGFAQGTTYHITYYAETGLFSKAEADSLLNKIDSSLSIYKSYSLISRFNANPSGIEMDEYLHTVVTKSLDIYKKTGGLSDITVYPIVNAWGFGPQAAVAVPDSSQIRALLPCVGSNKIHVRNNHLYKDLPCIKLDPNGIAQGYSVDLIAGLLEKKGVLNYLVEIGGELRVKGRKQPGNTLMKIGIESPAVNKDDEPVLKKIVQMDRGALTTSGNYRKYFERKGRSISHLMDPKTGYPIQNEMISVTVWAEDAITADGYDNAFMAMGIKNAFLFLKKHRDMEAYFIYRDKNGSVSDTVTNGFYKRMEK